MCPIVVRPFVVIIFAVLFLVIMPSKLPPQLLQLVLEYADRALDFWTLSKFITKHQMISREVVVEVPTLIVTRENVHNSTKWLINNGYLPDFKLEAVTCAYEYPPDKVTCEISQCRHEHNEGGGECHKDCCMETHDIYHACDPCLMYY